jgi:hypothetical protein
MYKNKASASKKFNENICISMIVKTCRYPLRNHFNAVLKEALHNLRETLSNKNINTYDKEKLFNKVVTLCNKVNFKKVSEGVGLFVSENVSQLVYFDIPVRDKVSIDENFNVKKIFLNDPFSLKAYVILLSTNHIRLIEVTSEKAKEIKSDSFPFQIENDSQNKSAYKSDLTKAYKEIRAAINTPHIPLLVCGPHDILESYKKISKIYFKNVYYFELNFDRSSLKEIWKFAFRWVKHTYDSQIETISEELEKNLH